MTAPTPTQAELEAAKEICTMLGTYNLDVRDHIARIIAAHRPPAERLANNAQDERDEMRSAALRDVARLMAERDAACADASQMYDVLLAVRESLERRSPGNGRDNILLNKIHPLIDAFAAHRASIVPGIVP